MIKTIFLSLLLTFSFNTLNVRAADSGPPPQVIQKTNPSYAEAKTLVKSKKFDKAVVMLDVKKRSGQNMIAAAEKIREIIEENGNRIE